MIAACSVAWIPGACEEASASTLTTEEWFECLDDLADRLDANDFWYSNDNNSRTFSGALRKSKVTNCARYVTWALQDFRIIDKKTVMWIKKGGGIGGNASSIRHNSKLKIMHPNKKARACSLRPGDICGWKDFQHTAVYAGKDSHGNMLWYSAGRDGGKRSGSKTYFKASRVKRKRRSSRYNGTISTVIRIQGLESETKLKTGKLHEMQDESDEALVIDSDLDGQAGGLPEYAKLEQSISAGLDAGTLFEDDTDAAPEPEVPINSGEDATEPDGDNLVIDGSDIKGEEEAEAYEEEVQETAGNQETYESPETADGEELLWDGVMFAGAIISLASTRRRRI